MDVHVDPGFRLRRYGAVAGRKSKGSAGWNFAAVLPARIAPSVSVSFFVGWPAVKSMSAKSTQKTFGLRVDSK